MVNIQSDAYITTPRVLFTKTNPTNWPTTTVYKPQIRTTTPQALALPFIDPKTSKQPVTALKAQRALSKVNIKTATQTKVAKPDIVSKTELQMFPKYGHHLLNLSMSNLNILRVMKARKRPNDVI